MPRDSAAPCLSERATGMALSVLTEIHHMLEALAESGRTGSIDLRSLPLSEADRAELEQALGRGEVQAQMDLAGESEVWETTYPGVWWIRHKGAGGKIATEEISVCRIPEILKTHPVDIEAAAARLKQELETTHV
jgi:hydrogenase-1 operon protein HyaF